MREASHQDWPPGLARHQRPVTVGCRHAAAATAARSTAATSKPSREDRSTLLYLKHVCSHNTATETL